MEIVQACWEPVIGVMCFNEKLLFAITVSRVKQFRNITKKIFDEFRGKLFNVLSKNFSPDSADSLIAYINSGVCVIYGSVLLDIIHGTSYAKDIDICQRKYFLSNSRANITHRRSTRRAIFYGDKCMDVDITEVACDPGEFVIYSSNIGFNKIYYGSRGLYIGDVKAVFTKTSDIHRGDLYYREYFGHSPGHNRISDNITKRVEKYVSRGYVISEIVNPDPEYKMQYNRLFKISE